MVSLLACFKVLLVVDQFGRHTAALLPHLHAIAVPFANATSGRPIWRLAMLKSIQSGEQWVDFILGNNRAHKSLSGQCLS